jgi:hypothetical protein
MADETEARIYRIIRFRQNGRRRVLKNNVTLAIAQLHCNDPRTRGPGWFDGYDYMPGCAPKERS